MKRKSFLLSLAAIFVAPLRLFASEPRRFLVIVLPDFVEVTIPYPATITHETVRMHGPSPATDSFTLRDFLMFKDKNGTLLAQAPFDQVLWMADK